MQILYGMLAEPLWLAHGGADVLQIKRFSPPELLALRLGKLFAVYENK